ncbi:hypothetical protein HK104_006145, partial [Borealophlyctis nickersoniae]
MASTFPHIHVHGIDLAPVQPRTVKPVNAHFTVADLTGPLPFDDGTFEFVRMRCCGWAIKSEQWRAVVAELARVTKVGGFVEVVEMAWPTGGDGER